MAAALVEVGHGRLTPQQLAAVVASGDRYSALLLPCTAGGHLFMLRHLGACNNLINDEMLVL
jgi:hypothetical protein